MSSLPRGRKALDEIAAGSCDGLTYEQIEEQYPNEFLARSQDKLRYRWGGAGLGRCRCDVTG